MVTIVRKEVSDRSFFGKLIKWIFIFFNVLMLVWIVIGAVAVNNVTATASNEAERAGATIGAGIGIMALIMLWGIGDVILGMFVLFTRRKKLIEISE